jgi:hypothetical protein
MTGWMLAAQAELFGLSIDALTKEQAARLLEEADVEAPTAGHDPIDDDEGDPAQLSMLEDASGSPGGPQSVEDGGREQEIDDSPIPPARDNEFVCAGCFLIWHDRLVADEGRRLCRDCADAFADALGTRSFP